MASVDEFSSAIGAAADTVESITAAIGAAKSSGEELAGQLAAMNVESKTEQANAVNNRLESEALAAAAHLKDLLEEIRGQAEALRG